MVVESNLTFELIWAQMLEDLSEIDPKSCCPLVTDINKGD